MSDRHERALAEARRTFRDTPVGRRQTAQGTFEEVVLREVGQEGFWFGLAPLRHVGAVAR